MVKKLRPNARSKGSQSVGQLQTNKHGMLGTTLAPFARAVHGKWTTTSLAPLDKYGGVGLSNFLTRDAATDLARRTAEAIRNKDYDKKGTTLQRTTGTGEAGHYFHITDTCVRKSIAAPLKMLDAVLGEKYPGAGLVFNRLGTHTGLVYGLGGKNYTHQDPATEYSCLQLLIFLGGSFGGGRFFVEDAGNKLQLAPARRRHEFQFMQPGDAVLFWSKPAKTGVSHPMVNPFHGMTEVTDAGMGPETVRFALAVGIAGVDEFRVTRSDKVVSWKPSGKAAWQDWAKMTSRANELRLGKCWKMPPSEFHRAGLELVGRKNYAVDTGIRANLQLPNGHRRKVTDADRGRKVDIAKVNELLAQFLK